MNHLFFCRVYMVRASWLQPHTRFSSTEFKQTANLIPGSTWCNAFQVLGGTSLEVTIAQFWSSLGESTIQVDISFHGLSVRPSEVYLDGSAGVKKIILRQGSIISQGL